MEDKIDLRWRKASYSGNGGTDCTEVATAPGMILVRDSKDAGGPMLAFTPESWQRFAETLKAP